VDVGRRFGVRQVRQAATAVGRWFADNPVPLWLVIFAAYLGARLVIMIQGPIYQSSDSAVYSARTDPTLNHGPLISLIGHAPRPWTVPVFYALFPDDRWRTIGQSALATIAWAALAWEAGKHLRTRTARYAIVAGLLLFGCLTEVASWDLAILTESLSISLGVLVLALTLRWLRTRSWAALAGTALITVCWTFVRPDIRVFTVVMIVVLGIDAVWPTVGPLWRRWRDRRGSARHRAAVPERTAGTRAMVTRRLIPAVAAAVVLLGSLGWYAAISPGMDRAMVPYDMGALRPDPLPQPEQVLVFRLRVDVSTDPAMWDAFRNQLGMPSCPELDAFRADPVWHEVEWAQAYTRCPALVTWVQARENQNFWTGLALKNPGLFLRKFSAEMSLNLGGAQYAAATHVVPAPLEKLVFPSRRYGLPVALVFFAVALGLAVWAGAWRAGGLLQRLFWAAIALFGVAMLSAAATVAVFTGELGRYGVRADYASRLSVIMLLGCALDAALLRRRARNSGGNISSTAAATSGPAQAAA
jgi:hypothetical protein